MKKGPKIESKIPDNINDLNTPMHAADHRVIKQMNLNSGTTGNSGLTPMLVGRTVDKDAKNAMDVLAKKSNLNQIIEEKDKEDEEDKAAKKKEKAKNASKALRGFT